MYESESRRNRSPDRDPRRRRATSACRKVAVRLVFVVCVRLYVEYRGKNMGLVVGGGN